MSFMFGIFGALVGSFLNVLVIRWGERLPTGRSQCPQCKATIRPRDLVPILSWLVLRGRCRDCNARISIQYPLVEAITALVFFSIGAAPLPLLMQLFALPLASTLIAIAIYDFRTTYIPDLWVYIFAILAFLGNIIFSLDKGIVQEFFDPLLSGALVAAPLFFLWFVSKGRWMGFGDVKLAVGMGFLLGMLGGIVALGVAFVVGAIVGLSLVGLGKSIAHSPRFAHRFGGLTMKSEVPFGPFLVAATLATWISSMHGISIQTFLFGL
jgi:leader peptidase (prepilin peptidase) / N-methyltransferase